MSRLKSLITGAALFTLLFGVSTPLVLAQTGTTIEPGNITGNLKDVQENSELGDQDLEESLGLLISVLLGVLGIIFLVLVIWAGFLWMTAGGDEKKVGKAKGILVTAVIGLVILLSAYAISSFVLNQLIVATGSGS